MRSIRSANPEPRMAHLPVVSAAARFDTLEPRRLLAVDLSAAVVSDTIPSTLVSGVSRTGGVTVSLRNLDTALAPRNSRPFNVVVQLVPSGQSSGTVIGSLRNTSIARLSSASPALVVRVPVAIPASTPAGTYSLVVTADPENRLAEPTTTQANNRVTVPGGLVIGSAFSSLQIASVEATFPSVEPGSPGRAKLTLRNDGNLPTGGRIDVRFFGVRQGTTERFAMGEVLDLPVRTLAPGRSAMVANNVPLVVPSEEVSDKGTEIAIDVVAEVVSRNLTGANTRADVSLAAAAPLRIVPPFSELEVATVTTQFPNTTPGTAGTATVSLRNKGNLTSRGNVTVRFFGVRQGSTDQVRMGDAITVPVEIAPGATAVIANNVPLIVPANGSNASVNLTLVAEINTATITPGDKNTVVRGAVATPLVLPPVDRTDNASPLVSGLGSTISFVITPRSALNPVGNFPDDPTQLRGETGRATDNLGRVGSYTWTYLPGNVNTGPDVILKLDFPGDPATGAVPFSSRYRVTFAGTPAPFTALDGRSLTFGVANNLSQGLVRFTESSGNTPSNDPGVTFRRD